MVFSQVVSRTAELSCFALSHHTRLYSPGFLQPGFLNRPFSPALDLNFNCSPNVFLKSYVVSVYEKRRDPVVSQDNQSLARLRSCALIDTITVLADISTAPTAGASKIPNPARRPAASGIATTLYPAAHQRF